MIAVQPRQHVFPSHRLQLDCNDRINTTALHVIANPPSASCSRKHDQQQIWLMSLAGCDYLMQSFLRICSSWLSVLCALQCNRTELRRSLKREKTAFNFFSKTKTHEESAADASSLLRCQLQLRIFFNDRIAVDTGCLNTKGCNSNNKASETKVLKYAMSQ